MSRPYVYVTRRLPRGTLGPLKKVAQVDVWPKDLPPSQDVLEAQAEKADALITLLTDRISDKTLSRAQRLRVISNVAVGIDNIDVEFATRNHIMVTNTPDVLTDATADFTFALLLSSARRVVEADRFVRSGRWRTWGPDVLLGQEVHGATLGIIGLGRIGLAVAQRARGFEMRVLYCSRSRKMEEERRLDLAYSELDNLLRRSDFISLHVPFSQGTRHLIGRREFSLMKRSAILINTARGAVVDTSALEEALAARRIAMAALDVTEPEPIPLDSPLLDLDNLIITPHIASAGAATRRKMAGLAVANTLAALNGLMPPNCVNPEAFTSQR